MARMSVATVQEVPAPVVFPVVPGAAHAGRAHAVAVGRVGARVRHAGHVGGVDRLPARAGGGAALLADAAAAAVAVIARPDGDARGRAGALVLGRAAAL